LIGIETTMQQSGLYSTEQIRRRNEAHNRGDGYIDAYCAFASAYEKPPSL
jgi:hypothetical protein